MLVLKFAHILGGIQTWLTFIRIYMVLTGNVLILYVLVMENQLEGTRK